MTNIYDMYKTNESKEKNGVWFAFDPSEDSEKFLLARAGGSNKKFEMRRLEKLQPFQRRIQLNAKKLDAATVELVEELTMQAFAETVILDWKNVKDEEGNLIPFSPENALELFTKLRGLYNELYEYAQQTAPFKDNEDIAKN